MILNGVLAILIIFSQLILSTSVKSAENGGLVADFNKVQEQLKAAGVENVPLEDVGFGIESTGTSTLNKIAKRLKESLGVFIVLNQRPNQKSRGSYLSDSNAVFLYVNEEDIKELLSWNNSRIKADFFHEIRHAFLQKTFDEHEKITPLSGALFGKNFDALQEKINPYIRFLSFQEYSTFAQDMKLLSSPENDIIKHQDQLFRSSSGFENFSDKTLMALDEIESQLNSNSKTIKIIDKTEEIRDLKIRYLHIETPNWNLDFQIPKSTLLNERGSMAHLAKERIISMRSIIQSMRSNNQELRKLLAEKNPDIQKIKDLINMNQRIAKRSYRPFLDSCENYFSNLFGLKK